MAFKVVSQVLRDWQIGTVLRYTSGAPIPIPVSANNLFQVLQRVNNFAAPATTVNRNPGVPLYVLPDGGSDPNCKCFDPNKNLVINRAAFTDAAPGQFGTAAPFYSDFRWMRPCWMSFAGAGK